MKVLIATTNKGKFKEIKKFLGDLPFEFLSLKDLDKNILEPEENGTTLEQNAMLKANYYGEKTGLITLSEDSGIFVKSLKNYPGVYSARIGKNDVERRNIILEKMKGKKNRTATFAIVCSLYNPSNQDVYLASGLTEGKITEKETGKDGFAYDPIFYVNAKKKTYAQMDMQEKNSCSHRGKALQKIKYYLQNQFGAKHIVVPCALIIQDKKLLITLRNDPHRKESHKKWEVPGGICDFGESVESTVIKEAKEEVGYKVKIIKQLQKIAVKNHKFPNFSYQVYLVPIICKIIGGKLNINNNEVLDAKWIDPTTHNKYDFLPGDNEWLDQMMPELLETIQENNL
ncbi:MAG TPA: non-canonical purine NTP pyrophosphatase, RdgB/HAM1 family [Candidatus Magasanikbacteria bacterium]|nr:non-canonical purine NTP pyrophosphatase, RdgB/HAM1 family [Candidatus Magasanikbacteria bacterium]